jgi:Zn-dependent protease
MQYNPYYQPPGRPRIRYSRLELQHLLIATLGLTAAFTLFLGPPQGISLMPRLRAIQADPMLPLAAFIAIAVGFVPHELAHKILAQRFGHWAEFRMSMRNLLIGLAIVLGLKILYAAPGAVMISGRVTPKENGLISLVGPGVNFVITAITLPFAFGTNATATLPIMMATVAWINAILAAFNMLPIGPLDGRKVWNWNKAVYLAVAAAAVALVIFTWASVDPLVAWRERIGPV